MSESRLAINKSGHMFWQDGQLIYNGKYKIEKYLGGGGFAVTYQAMHTKLNRRVVIKTPNISVQRDPDYPKYVERFKKEAKMLAMCCTDSHPHIVQVFDFFEVDGRYCLEMQYIAGDSLWNYVLLQGKLPETEAVKYIRQMGLALVEVHKKGVFHLDVTPSNIMLNFDPKVPNSDKAVLIDFGIAGDMSPPSTLSRSFGNKAFAPYELRKGIRHPTVDVYCLAGSLYYAITGKRPTNSFDRKYEQEELVPPKQHVPSLSDAVNQGILQGMALEAKDRPQTMQEYLDLLVPHSSFTDYYHQGHAAYKIRDYERAIANFTQAIEQKPTDVTTIVNRGNARYNLKDYEGAVIDYSQALKINPNQIKALVNRGNARYMLAEYNNDPDTEYNLAIADYNRAIGLDNNEVEAYIRRGIVRTEMAKYSGESQQAYKRAIADFTQAIKLNVSKAEAYFQRGNVYYKIAQYSSNYQQEYNQAIADFNQALTISPKLAKAYLKRGMVCYELALYGGSESNKNYTKAIEDIQVSAKIFLEQDDMDNYQQALSNMCVVIENKCDPLFHSSSNVEKTN